jgi:hypothetical protein
MSPLTEESIWDDDESASALRHRPLAQLECAIHTDPVDSHRDPRSTPVSGGLRHAAPLLFCLSVCGCAAHCSLAVHAVPHSYRQPASQHAEAHGTLDRCATIRSAAQSTTAVCEKKKQTKNCSHRVATIHTMTLSSTHTHTGVFLQCVNVRDRRSAENVEWSRACVIFFFVLAATRTAPVLSCSAGSEWCAQRWRTSSPCTTKRHAAS